MNMVLLIISLLLLTDGYVLAGLYEKYSEVCNDSYLLPSSGHFLILQHLSDSKYLHIVLILLFNALLLL